MSSILSRLNQIKMAELKAKKGRGLVGGAMKKDCPKGLSYRNFVKQCGGVPKVGEWEAYKMGIIDVPVQEKCPKGLSYRNFVKQCGGVPKKGQWEAYKMGAIISPEPSQIPMPPADWMETPIEKQASSRKELMQMMEQKVRQPDVPMQTSMYDIGEKEEEEPMMDDEAREEEYREPEIEFNDPYLFPDLIGEGLVGGSMYRNLVCQYGVKKASQILKELKSGKTCKMKPKAKKSNKKMGKGLVGGAMDEYVNICKKASKADLERYLMGLVDSGIPLPPPVPKSNKLLTSLSEKPKDLLSELKARKAPVESYQPSESVLEAIKKSRTGEVTPEVAAYREIQRADAEKKAKVAASSSDLFSELLKKTEKKRAEIGSGLSKSKKSKKTKKSNSILTYKEYVKKIGGVPKAGEWAKVKKMMGKGLVGGKMKGKGLVGGCMSCGGCCGNCPMDD